MKDRIKQALELLRSGTAVTLLLVASKPDGQLEYRKVKMAKKLGEKFSSNTVAYLQGLQEGVEEGSRDLLRYFPGYKTDAHEMQYISTAEPEYEFIKPVIDGVPMTTGVAVFDAEEKSFVSKITYYVLVFESKDGKRLLVYRKYSAQKELTRSHQFAAVFNQGTYDKFEDKVFLFDEKVDCFFIEDTLIIDNTYFFLLIFKYYDGLKQQAHKIVDDIVARIPISNVDEFRNHCTGQLQMLAKLGNISSKPYFNTITMDDLKRTIDQFKLDVRVIEDDGKEKLVFEKTNRWGLLRLLDDDYLGSTMTNTQYMVNSKQLV